MFLDSFTMNQSGQYGVQNMIEVLARIFRKEPQHEISILLQQGVFPPVTPIGFSIGEMLRAIQFNDNAGLDA